MKLGSIRTPALGGGVLLALWRLALGSLAHAAQDADGNLRGSFSGGISPRKLPRTELAPVSVQMGGKISTTDRSVPPKLARILLAINSHGELQSKALAACSLGKLNSITSTEAKRVCGDAMVGHGNVTSRVSLPGQSPFASNADLLAFNGKLKGKPAVLAQVSSGR